MLRWHFISFGRVHEPLPDRETWCRYTKRWRLGSSSMCWYIECDKDKLAKTHRLVFWWFKFSNWTPFVSNNATSQFENSFQAGYGILLEAQCSIQICFSNRWSKNDLQLVGKYFYLVCWITDLIAMSSLWDIAGKENDFKVLKIEWNMRYDNLKIKFVNNSKHAHNIT